MTEFRKYIQQMFIPCCIVYSSDTAKNILKKNNLTPSLFLRPFGDFRGKDIVFSYGKEKSFEKISNFMLDFYDAENYSKFPPNKIKSILKNVYKSDKFEPNWNMYEMNITKQNVDHLFINVNSYSLPWFREFEKAYFEMLQFKETEMFQQPIIYIYLISIKDNINIINDIKYQQNCLLIKEDIFEDNNMPKMIIFLNDGSDANNFVNNNEKINSIINQFKNKYYHFHTLLFNINLKYHNICNDITFQPLDDIWENYIHKIDLYNNDNSNQDNNNNITDINSLFNLGNETNNNNTNNIKGKYISKEERDNFSKIFYNSFNDRIKYQLIKLAENLQAEINDNKGLKRFFSSKKSNDKSFEIVKSFKIYNLTPYEKKLYLLGILLFYIHYYNEANEVIKSLLSEIKTKSKVHYDSILQMRRICSFCKNVNKKPEKHKIYESFNQYIKDSDILYGIRALFIQIKVMESFYLFDDIRSTIWGVQLIFSNYDISYINSFLNEKFSYYFLGVYPINLRRFAAEMFFSGNLYFNEGIDFYKYAINCYGKMYKIINNNNYTFIKFKDKLYSLMAKICYIINYIDAGIFFYKKAIDISTFYYSNIQNKIKISDIEMNANLTEYFNNLFELIAKSNNDNINSMFYNFSIPVIDNSSFTIINKNTYDILKYYSLIRNCSSGFMNFNKYTYVPLNHIYVNLSNDDIIEFKVIDYLLNNKIFSNYKINKKQNYNEDEEIVFRFLIKNPLNMDLNITGLTVIYEVINDKGEIISNNYNNNNNDNNNNKNGVLVNQDLIDLNALLNINSNNDDNGSKTNSEIIQCEEKEFILKALKEEIIYLKCKLKQKGKIVVKGIKLILFQNIMVHNFFYIKSIKDKNFSNTNNNDYKLYSYYRSKTKNTSTNNLQGFQKYIENKHEFLIQIMDKNDNIFINFPMGTEINIFQYNLLYFPINIKNTLQQNNMSRFTIFLYENNINKDNKDNKDIISNSLLCNYITKELDIKNESKTILIPIWPKKLGCININILIKFESAYKKNNIQTKKYVLKLNVYQSISIKVNEEKLEFLNNQENNYIKTKYNFEVFIKNNQLKNIQIDNTFLFNNTIHKIIDDSNNDLLNVNNNGNFWYLINNELYDKYYNSFTLMSKINGKFLENNNIINLENFDFNMNKNDLINYQSIKKIYEKLIYEKNFLILLFTFENKNKYKYFGLYLHKLNMNKPIIDNCYIKNLLLQDVQMNIDYQLIDDDEYYVEIKVNIINGNNIKYLINFLQVSINDKSNDYFNWIGTKKWTFFFEPNKDKNYQDSMTFTYFIPKNKGLINANQLIFSTVLYENLDQYNKQSNDINSGNNLLSHLNKNKTIIDNDDDILDNKFNILINRDNYSDFILNGDNQYPNVITFFDFPNDFMINI